MAKTPPASGAPQQPAPRTADPRARLLAGAAPAGHGTFSATPSDAGSRPDTPSSGSAGAGAHPHARALPHPAWMKRAATTAELARAEGVHHPWLMYASYYIPSIAWVGRYEWKFLLGDVVAGVTMASFYIPMALSLSANLAHLPPIHGLYAFAVQPLVYALLGSCPTMAVGPEAAGSLLLGSAIRMMQEHHDPAFDDEPAKGDPQVMAARLAGVITAMTGAIAFSAGAVRLGFLDSVLSRPLLRGFISGVGFVIFIDQLLAEMGLVARAAAAGVTRASTLAKIRFLFSNLSHTHRLTFLVSLVSFSTILISRSLKNRFSKRLPYIVFLPDRFAVVVLSAVLTYQLDWSAQGLEVLGAVESSEGGLFHFTFPFALTHLTHVKETLSTAFLIAVLGFFESVVAAKSLGTTLDVSISSNRELIALGTANMLGGCFGALPAFGGYGRSKVNKATGGRTPLSSVVLALCTIVCVLFLLPYFYHLPRCVLSAMISVVAVSLLEEAPHDIVFFARIRGWHELATMALVFVTTIAWDLSTGIAVGVGISLVTVIRHSTQARITILGRAPGAAGAAADDNDDAHAFRVVDEPLAAGAAGAGAGAGAAGALVVKVREPLTFSNAGTLAQRLWRIDRYGDARAHPSLPRLTGGHGALVFDVAGVTAMDGSGAQTLRDTVHQYVARGVQVWFCRVPGGQHGPVAERMRRAGIVALIGGPAHLVDRAEDALKAAEAAVAAGDVGEV